MQKCQVYEICAQYIYVSMQILIRLINAFSKMRVGMSYARLGNLMFGVSECSREMALLTNLLISNTNNNCDVRLLTNLGWSMVKITHTWF